jgi:hypothetical protein
LLALGCAGILLAVIALCIPNPKAAPLPEPVETPVPMPVDNASDPESAPGETFVAVLEGEEPLVVDTAEETTDSEEQSAD